MKIEHKVHLDTAAENVWSVIYTMENYPKWNPFVKQCESSLCVGDPIKMKVQLLPYILLPQKETIQSHKPNEVLSYGIALPFSILNSHREHKVLKVTDNKSVYVSTFSLSGWFAPVVDMLLGRQLNKGFAAMTAALAKESVV